MCWYLDFFRIQVERSCSLVLRSQLPALVVFFSNRNYSLEKDNTKFATNECKQQHFWRHAYYSFFFLSNLKLNPFFTFLMQKLAGKTVKLKKYSSPMEA